MGFWWNRKKPKTKIAIVMLCPNSALVVFDHDGNQIPDYQAAGSRTVAAFLRVYAAANPDTLFELRESNGMSFKSLRRDLDKSPKRIETIFDLRRYLKEGATLETATF